MNSPTRLILVRHGNTFETGQVCTHVGSRTDMPLTSQGKDQALQISRFLKKHGHMPKAIFAGTLSRQKETARIIADNIFPNPPIYQDIQALTEVDYGPWEGLTTEQIEEKWPVEYAQWSEQAIWPENIFPESQVERIKNLQEWVEYLRINYPGETILGVTSNGIIRYFYSFVRHEWQTLMQQKNMKKLKVKTGHLCELLIEDHSLLINSWNLNPSSEKDFK